MRTQRAASRRIDPFKEFNADVRYATWRGRKGQSNIAPSAAVRLQLLLCDSNPSYKARKDIKHVKRMESFSPTKHLEMPGMRIDKFATRAEFELFLFCCFFWQRWIASSTPFNADNRDTGEWWWPTWCNRYSTVLPFPEISCNDDVNSSELPSSLLEADDDFFFEKESTDISFVSNDIYLKAKARAESSLHDWNYLEDWHKLIWIRPTWLH